MNLLRMQDAIDCMKRARDAGVHVNMKYFFRVIDGDHNIDARVLTHAEMAQRGISACFAGIMITDDYFRKRMLSNESSHQEWVDNADGNIGCQLELPLGVINALMYGQTNASRNRFQTRMISPYPVMLHKVTIDHLINALCSLRDHGFLPCWTHTPDDPSVYQAALYPNNFAVFV